MSISKIDETPNLSRKEFALEVKSRKSEVYATSYCVVVWEEARGQV